MKKRFGKLPKSERQKIEAQYHRMKLEDLDKPMSHARRHSPGAIRLPPELIETLKMVAESEGEPEYQARWYDDGSKNDCDKKHRLETESSNSRAAAFDRPGERFV